MEEFLLIALILSLMLLLFSGYPVALVLIGVSVIFAAVAIGLDLMPVQMLSLFPLRMIGTFSENLLYPAVPPLIFMGVALEKSGLARDLFVSIAYFLKNLPGGLMVAVLLLGVVLAPAAGLIGASVAMLALAALPTMLTYGYSPKNATASVAAAGTAGIIIPPGIILFFLADLLEVPILGTFSGVLFPVGLLLLVYATYFVILALIQKNRKEILIEGLPEGPIDWSIFLASKLMLPIVLIGLVLGSIVSGWATPTQAGSIGAAGAFVLMILNRSISWALMHEVVVETGLITAMVFFVIIGANAFSFMFRILGGDDHLPNFLSLLQLGDWGSLMFILGVIFVLGFFIDWIEIVLITLPIFYPVISDFDFSAHVGDPLLTRVWIAVAIAIVLQTSFLTPPFGFALFFLRGSAPPEVQMVDIYRGAAPLVGIQIAVLAAVLMFPVLAIELPSMLLD